MKWPDLFIVGAPKCGTTAMTRFLEAHPEVQMAARKDLHFFGSDLGFRNRERIGEAEYLAHFQNDDSKRIRAESSVWYLYSERAASEIAACNPDARILILLRHPVEMMHALWAQLRLNGLGDEDITEFAEALAAEPDRIRGRRIPSSTPLPEALYYRRTARFSEQIRRFRDCFPDEQLRILIQEEMKQDTLGTWKSVCEWLEIDTEIPLDSLTVNRSKAVRSEGFRNLIGTVPQGVKRLVPTAPRRRLSRWIRKMNSSHVERSPLDDALRQRLTLEFDEEITRVESMLGRKIACWTR